MYQVNTLSIIVEKCAEQSSPSFFVFIGVENPFDNINDVNVIMHNLISFTGLLNSDIEFGFLILT